MLISGIMLIPIYLIVKNQRISFQKLAKDIGRLYIYIFFVISVWIVMITIRQYMSVNNIQIFPSEIVSEGGRFVGLFLMISFPFSYLVSDTKYWNNFVSNIFGMCNYSLLLVFVTIVIKAAFSIMQWNIIP